MAFTCRWCQMTYDDVIAEPEESCNLHGKTCRPIELIKEFLRLQNENPLISIYSPHPVPSRIFTLNECYDQFVSKISFLDAMRLILIGDTLRAYSEYRGLLQLMMKVTRDFTRKLSRNPTQEELAPYINVSIPLDPWNLNDPQYLKSVTGL